MEFSVSVVLEDGVSAEEAEDAIASVMTQLEQDGNYRSVHVHKEEVDEEVIDRLISQISIVDDNKIYTSSEIIDKLDND